MANKTLNTRIRLKYDTYQNWDTNNPVLLSGEIAVVVVPASTGAVQQEPAVLMKVGNGSDNFKTLPWISGNSADIYNWAKSPTKPSYTADEISGLDDYISGQIEDTDTQYQVVTVDNTSFKLQSKPKTGGEWADVGSPIKITYTLVEGGTNGTVSFNGKEVKVHGLGSAAYVETSAFDPAGSATNVKNEVIGSSGDLSTANTIYGAKKYAEEKSSAAQSAAQGYADTQIGAAKTELIGTGNATSNTIKGAVEESKGYTDEQIAAKIGSVYKPSGSVAFASLPQPGEDNLGNVYNITDEFTTDSRFVSGETGKKYPAGSNVAVVKVEDSYFFDVLSGVVDLTNYAEKTYVGEQISAAKTELIGSDSGVNATTIKGAVTESKGYADGLKSQTDSKISQLETEVGKKANDSDLAAIAKTGNVNDLVQTESEYIIFDCGNASTLIN